jgi:tRNA(Ile)-lysidine synthase
MDLAPDSELVIRFAADLDALVEPAGRVGIAVSGGPDSLALLLLAAAARPGLVEAATVDHGLRPESRTEVEMVALICERLGVPHRILKGNTTPPASNLQAWARGLRYALLADWAVERDLDAVATAHHVDDQAETLLLRIARGSGVAGLTGVQRCRPLTADVRLVRPLLDWRHSDLRRIVDRAGIVPVEDPSNIDERFDRSRARALLEGTDWLDPHRLAAVASNAIDAEGALQWASSREFENRRSGDRSELRLDPSDLPRELKRRLLLMAIEQMTGESPPGPKLIAALETLEAGGTTTLAGLKLEGGASWRLTPAPPRRPV